MERFGELSLAETASWTDEEVEHFLTSLPGIAIKSARCVMMYSLGRQVLPVDTHLRRLAERWGEPQERGDAENGNRPPPPVQRRLAHRAAAEREHQDALSHVRGFPRRRIEFGTRLAGWMGRH